MFLAFKEEVEEETGLPHASGDVSKPLAFNAGLTASSPCEWGCFYKIFRATAERVVFPMRVGMFLNLAFSCDADARLPHASGDVS